MRTAIWYALNALLLVHTGYLHYCWFNAGSPFEVMGAAACLPFLSFLFLQFLSCAPCFSVIAFGLLGANCGVSLYFGLRAEFGGYYRWKPNEQLLFWSAAACYCSLWVGLMLAFLFVLCQAISWRRSLVRSEASILEIYDSIAEEGTNIQKLLAKNKAGLSKQKLLRKEIAILEDSFQRPGSLGEAQACLVCMEPFETDSRLLEHPKCHHLFHSKCLKEWLCEKPSRA